MCEASIMIADGSKNKERMINLLNSITDEDVSKAMDELTWLLEQLAKLDSNLKGMYILHYVSGTDKDNKNVVLETECVFGAGTIKFATMFSPPAAQSLMEALKMNLAMIEAGHRLGEEGNA